MGGNSFFLFNLTKLYDSQLFQSHFLSDHIFVCKCGIHGHMQPRNSFVFCSLLLFISNSSCINPKLTQLVVFSVIILDGVVSSDPWWHSLSTLSLCRWIMPKFSTMSERASPFPPACCLWASSRRWRTNWPKHRESTTRPTSDSSWRFWPS